ncbi:orotate phosphoribosyltransferase [soil metagenome]
MIESLPESSEEALEILRGFGAVEEGHFLLASGKHSAHYVQKARIVERPKELQALIGLCLPALRALGRIDVVFSPAMGGVPVGQQVGLALGARTIYAERDAETDAMELRRGFGIGPGERVLMVEDVITTGGTLAELNDRFVAARGAELAGVFAVVNRSGSPRWQGVPVVSCMTVDLPAYAADAVPDWLAARPVIRPGTKKVDN